MMHSLVLNRSWLPIYVADWQRAVSLVYSGHAQIVGQDYCGYDFENWADISREKVKSEGDSGLHIVRSQKYVIIVPDIIALTLYDKLPPHEVILTRESIFVRDRHKCAYCGKKHKREDLTWDHVIPRFKGGKNTWENLVTCCYDCNQQKLDRTPSEARMPLLIVPSKPKWRGRLGLTLGKIKVKESWQSWLDKAYWNAELDED